MTLFPYPQRSSRCVIPCGITASLKQRGVKGESLGVSGEGSPSKLPVGIGSG